jgi:hypothetical protein
MSVFQVSVLTDFFIYIYYLFIYLFIQLVFINILIYLFIYLLIYLSVQSSCLFIYFNPAVDYLFTNSFIYLFQWLVYLLINHWINQFISLFMPSGQCKFTLAYCVSSLLSWSHLKSRGATVIARLFSMKGICYINGCFLNCSEELVWCETS